MYHIRSPSCKDCLKQQASSHVIAHQAAGRAAAASLGNLTSLKELSLEYQALAGPLPDNLAASPKLRTLGLGFNSFLGGFPSSIGSSTSLREVTAMAANLSGPLPLFSGAHAHPEPTPKQLRPATAEVGYRLSGTCHSSAATASDSQGRQRDPKKCAILRM